MSRILLVVGLALAACVAQKSVRGSPVVDPKIADTLTNAGVSSAGVVIGVESSPASRGGLCHGDEPDPQHTCPQP